jgi:hypothetical protein
VAARRRRQSELLRQHAAARHVDHPEAPSLLQQYLESKPQELKVGGAPKQTAPGDTEGKKE